VKAQKDRISKEFYYSDSSDDDFKMQREASSPLQREVRATPATQSAIDSSNWGLVDGSKLKL